MIKKLSIIVVLCTLVLTGLSAQAIRGKWKANQEFKRANLADGTDLYLEFEENSMNLSISVDQVKDGTSVTLLFTIPGTYTKKGTHVKALYDYEKVDVEIINFSPSNSTMKATLKDPKKREEILWLMKQQIINGSEDAFDGIKDISKECFTDFDIRMTGNKLLILLNSKMNATFLRVRKANNK
jgi:hypothetical protein